MTPGNLAVLEWLRKHYLAADFAYGDEKKSMLIFGPLPRTAKVTGDLERDVLAVVKLESA